MNLKDGDLANPVPLSDFMSELGTIMQLPKKEGPVAPPPVVAASRAAHPVWSLRTLLLPVVALLLAGGFAWARVANHPSVADLPSELQGEWRTKHPKYRDRLLSFTTDRVGLALTEGRAAQLHPISALSMRTRADTTVLSITYVEEGTPVDFRVSLVRGARPMLWLSNPPDVVWEPVRSATTATSAAATPGATPAALPAAVTTGPTSQGAEALPALPAARNWRK